VSFRIFWSFRALNTLYALPPWEAMGVDRAVIRLAGYGEGRLTWVAPHHRLATGKHDLALAIDRGERTITVLRIYRA
jgi:hypothetical protein